jgi:hypothetical protein
MKILSLAALAAASAGMFLVSAGSFGQATTRPLAAGASTVPSTVAPPKPGLFGSGPTTRTAPLAAAPTTRSTTIVGAPTTRTSPAAGGLGGPGLRGTTGTIGTGTTGTGGVFGGRTGATTQPGTSTAGANTGTGGLFGGRNGGRTRNNNGNNGGVGATPQKTPTGGDTMQIPTPPPMTQAYASQFSQRSIFQRGLPPVAPQIVFAPQPVGPDPNILAQENADAARARLERSLIFNGVSVENGVPVAFIEDISAFTVTRVHEHDYIGRGTVGKITLDTLQYIVGSRVSTITIGNSLAGQSYLRSTTTPSQLEINQLQASLAATQKSGDTSVSADDLLTQMKLRRLQELGSLSLPDNAPTTQPAEAPAAPDDAAPGNP